MNGGGFSCETLDERPGLLIFRVTGTGANRVFTNEGGGHRWQRIPPTERNGRVHTSTVTVAVLPEPTAVEVEIRQQDIEWTACRGSGAGGQARNKTSNAVQMKHSPTGVSVRVESERSQRQNYDNALGLLRARIQVAATARVEGARAGERKAQVGTGQRGDKIRTYRTQDDVVTDHRTGKKARLKDVLRGDLSELR